MNTNTEMQSESTKARKETSTEEARKERLADVPEDEAKPSDFKQEAGRYLDTFRKNWVIYQIIKMSKLLGDRWVTFTKKDLIKHLDPEIDVRAALDCLDILVEEDRILDRTANSDKKLAEERLINEGQKDATLDDYLYGVNMLFFEKLSEDIVKTAPPRS